MVLLYKKISLKSVRRGKNVASRTVNDENIFSFSSQTVVLTLTWNKRGLKNPAAAVRTLETKAQEDKIQTVLL